MDHSGIKGKIEHLVYCSIPHWGEEFYIWLRRKLDRLISSDTFILVLMLLGIAFACFATTYFSNMFTIPLGGDYILQEIPFIFNGWDDWHHFFETGEFVLWDTSGFLGVNNIGANCFYYLTSPWFFIYLLFPRGALPQVQGILTMFKLMTAGLLFYKYLECFKLEEKTRKMGAIAYAFCGWMFYNLWFHFIDAAAFLPLLLLGIERVLQKKGPMVLLSSIVLLGLTNYFFLASFCIASMFYVLFRVIQTWRSRNLKETLKVGLDGIIGYVLGLLTVAVVLLPSIITVMEMPRVSSGGDYLGNLLKAPDLLAKLKALFVFPTPYEAVYPLTSFFFMNITCFGTNLFRNAYYNNTMSSIFVFTPFVLMLIPSVLNSVRTRKYSHLFGFAATALMLFTPFCYYLFHAFTIGYGRWEVIAVCWMLVFFLLHYDDRKNMPRFYMDISIVFTLAMMLLGYYLSKDIQANNSNTFNPPDGREILVPLQMGYAVVVYLVMRFFFKKSHLSDIMITMLAFEAVVMGNVTIQVQGLQRYQDLAGGLDNVNEERKVVEALNSYDSSFYRIFNTSADRGANNQAMRLGYNGLGTFHSVYPFEAKDLLEWSRINYNNSWSMGVHEKRYNLDALLGVKYYLLKSSDNNIPYGAVPVVDLDSGEDQELRKLQQKLTKYEDHQLYLNQNFVDSFFVYDTLISSSVMNGAYSGTISEDSNEVNYLKYGIVDRDELEKLREEDPALYEKFNRNSSLTNSLSYATKARNTIKIPSYSKRLALANWKDGVYDHGKEEESEEYPYYINPKDTLVNYSDYSNTSENPVSYYSKLIFDLGTPICPNADPSDPQSGCYVSVAAKLGYNIRFYLYGEPSIGADGEEVVPPPFVWDFHTWNGYDKTYDWKYTRGFYTDRPVDKIVGIFYDNIPALKDLGIYSDSPKVSYLENSVYQQDIDRLKEERKHIEVSRRTANTINFSTGFSEGDLHYVVINYPLDQGWKLTRSYRSQSGEEILGEEVKLFKSQGGLIGFDAINAPMAGDEVAYELTYVPKGLKIGTAAGIIGWIGTGFLGGIYISRMMNRKFAARREFSLIDTAYDKEPWEKKRRIRRKHRR